MATIQVSRGTRDILPSEVSYWQFIERSAREILDRAGVLEIRTPIFEQTELFARGMGEATDVVSKEMYSFVDRGDRGLTLRPEGTAGVVRSLIENNLQAQGGVQRLWYVGPMFRYERPQAGRQRQFHQLGLEMLGSADERADVEAIAIATDILKAIGLKDLTFDLNSIGDMTDRAAFRSALVEYLTPYAAELDPDSQDRLTRNPLRILDSKDKNTQKLLDGAPSILDHLSEGSKARFDRVQQLLADLNIPCQVNSRLVRGLDYYSHTVFEIQSADLGAQATVCAGGRYDGLVTELGGPQTPAIGWAMGLERLVILLQKLETTSSVTPVDFYLISKGTKAEGQALVLVQQLRQAGFKAELDLSGSAFGKQFKRADRSAAAACLIVGDAEAEKGTAQLKWLASGDQSELVQSELASHFEAWRTALGDRLKG
jgi:histidyl-tRNA synthetase